MACSMLVFRPETIASLTVLLGDVLHAKSTGLLISGAAKVCLLQRWMDAAPAGHRLNP